MVTLQAAAGFYFRRPPLMQTVSCSSRPRSRFPGDVTKLKPRRARALEGNSFYCPLAKSRIGATVAARSVSALCGDVHWGLRTVPSKRVQVNEPIVAPDPLDVM
ncbi:hypothetical protein NDU88_009448 [Pleurodeles waltl]|uniref:Uncharacterized protein n=1 Tax=Pleurodeles waltl TaxID=8319 RepID=A0AAV7RZ17_PLEWA|nr:hypothetical protein NDU88_009448 [Pleurodeles waltl]